MKNYFKDLFVPFKLFTLAIGIAILCFGAIYEQLPDWDFGVSFVMAILTFLTAPFVCITLKQLDWRRMPLAAFLAWFSIDGSYWIYNAIAGHLMVREANFYASTPLYFMCGLFWMMPSLKQIFSTRTKSFANDTRSR
jgi:hypothetical protein